MKTFIICLAVVFMAVVVTANPLNQENFQIARNIDSVDGLNIYSVQEQTLQNRPTVYRIRIREPLQLREPSYRTDTFRHPSLLTVPRAYAVNYPQVLRLTQRDDGQRRQLPSPQQFWNLALNFGSNLFNNRPRFPSANELLSFVGNGFSQLSPPPQAVEPTGFKDQLQHSTPLEEQHPISVEQDPLSRPPLGQNQLQTIYRFESDPKLPSVDSTVQIAPSTGVLLGQQMLLVPAYFVSHQGSYAPNHFYAIPTSIITNNNNNNNENPENSMSEISEEMDANDSDYSESGDIVETNESTEQIPIKDIIDGVFNQAENPQVVTSADEMKNDEEIPAENLETSTLEAEVQNEKIEEVENLDSKITNIKPVPKQMDFLKPLNQPNLLNISVLESTTIGSEIQSERVDDTKNSELSKIPLIHSADSTEKLPSAEIENTTIDRNLVSNTVSHGVDGLPTAEEEMEHPESLDNKIGVSAIKSIVG